MTNESDCQVHRQTIRLVHAQKTKAIFVSRQSASLQNDRLKHVSGIFSNIAKYMYALLTMTKTTLAVNNHKSTCSEKKIRKLLVGVNITHGRSEAFYFYSQVSGRFMLPFGILKGARRRVQNIFLKKAGNLRQPFAYFC